MDRSYTYWVDAFFAAADRFRAETGADPVAVSLPTWSLHALARVPEIALGLKWPGKEMEYPPTILGLPVIALGGEFQFYGRTDNQVAPWASRLPDRWPWTGAPAYVLYPEVEEEEDAPVLQQVVG